MASDVEVNLKYFARIQEANLDQLAGVYNWEHLSVANEDGYIWIKDISEGEINSVALKSILGIERFYVKQGKLYPLHKLLPIGNEPACLWTKIKRAIPLDLPSKNHNFFDLIPCIKIKIIPSSEPREASIHLIDLSIFKEYIKTASTLRLSPMLWLVLDDRAMVVGRPLLPLPGATFWKSGSFIFSSGHELELPSLRNAINKKINPLNDYDVLWNADQSFVRIPKTAYSILSRSSVAKTLESINIKNGDV